MKHAGKFAGSGGGRGQVRRSLRRSVLVSPRRVYCGPRGAGGAAEPEAGGNAGFAIGGCRLTYIVDAATVPGSAVEKGSGLVGSGIFGAAGVPACIKRVNSPGWGGGGVLTGVSKAG